MSDIPKTPNLNTLFYNSVAALAKANDNLRHMQELTNKARREEADALNRVNEAQRTFDALVFELKKIAPRDTDWKRPPPCLVGGTDRD